jgi:hypothetical protein
LNIKERLCILFKTQSEKRPKDFFLMLCGENLGFQRGRGLSEKMKVHFAGIS